MILDGVFDHVMSCKRIYRYIRFRGSGLSMLLRFIMKSKGEIESENDIMETIKGEHCY